MVYFPHLDHLERARAYSEDTEINMADQDFYQIPVICWQL